MTTGPTTPPGCYSSALFYRVTAPECVACALKESCADAAKRAELPALHGVWRLDQRFKTDSVRTVKRWFDGRWKVNATAQRASERVREMLASWSASGLNVYLLKHRINPARKDVDALANEAFQYVIDTGPFKPRDVVEHLRDTFPDRTKASLTSYVTMMCQALVSENILKKEGHILCL